MTNSDTWNRAYATALREFAAMLQTNIDKADKPMNTQQIVHKMNEFADVIWSNHD